MFQDEEWKKMGPRVSLWDPEDVKETKECRPVEQKQKLTNGTQSKDQNEKEDTNEDKDSDDENDAPDIIFDDMQLFCHTIGEPQLVDKFLHHKVTLGQLMNFDENDLINCGIELVGERKKILASTVQMHNEKWMPSSLNDPTGRGLFSSPGYYIALNDINKHLEYIGVTVRYLKRRLQTSPEIMELGKDFVGVTKVASEIDDLLKTSKTTHLNILSLGRQVNKHVSDPILKPAFHIDENLLRKQKFKRVLMGPVLVTATAVITFYVTLKFVKSSN